MPAAYGWRENGGLWLDVPDVATFHLPAGGAALTAIADDLVDSDTVLGAYYDTALPFAVQATLGLEVLHGSAVLVPSGGCAVAFCGKSESGKSTFAYGLAARGYTYWADDSVAFRVEHGESVISIGLPFAVNLREGSSAYFEAVGADRSAKVADPVEDFEGTSAPLAAAFLLEPIDAIRAGVQPVAVERLVAGAALHALLPNSYRFQPQPRKRKRQTMQTYLELVASVPVLRVRFPRGIDRLTELLDVVERWIADVA